MGWRDERGGEGWENAAAKLWAGILVSEHHPGLTAMAAVAAAQLPMRELEAGVKGDTTGFQEMVPNTRGLLGS